MVNIPKRRNRAGCILGCLSALVVLALLLGVAWVFALRPYVHDQAVAQLDNAMTNAVNQIPAVELPIPTGTVVPVSESAVNNALANNASSSDIVQGANMRVSANQVLLDFKIFGQDCTVTTVPQMQNGKLVATNVAISGIVGLILSPADITKLLNSHIEDAQTRMNHRFTQVKLIDHEIDVTVS